jgi:hypothetical protein
MTKQFDATPSAHPTGPADTNRKQTAPRPTEISPAEISHPRQQAAMDAELAAIDNKLKRLLGKPELNHKQWESVFALMRAHESIVNPGWRKELSDLIDGLEE